MSPVLDQLPDGARVLLIRLRSLGDCVLTTPAIQLLNQHRPDLRIAIAVEERFAGIYEGNPQIGEILAPSLRAAARWRPSLTVNLHGGTRSVQLTLASLAAQRAGYQHFRARRIYNIHIPRAQEILGVERTVHTAEHVASAMFYLGVPQREIPRASLYTTTPAQSTRPYCVIHPMASAPEKTWPAARFLEIAPQLPLRPIFIGGPGEDLSPFQAYETRSNTPLAGIKSLLEGASLFIGNDSGPAHMAAAFGLPVVVLYGPSDPVVWAPWKTEAESVIAEGPLADLPAALVLRAVERLGVRA